MALPEGLLTAAKNELDISWEDDATNTKLSGILERGIVYIDRHAGAAQDYMTEGDARALLFSYARYARAGSLHLFETSYLHELLALQINTTVPVTEGGT